jgi:NTP pyrophosphatase (non-canonical NTP hydrolase)
MDKVMTTDNLNTAYGDMVYSLAKPGKDIVDNMTSSTAHLLHMAVGISGEAGELLDAIKKHVIYNKPLDINNVVEELGDLEFYMEGLRTALGLDRASILIANMNKLGKRYASGTYTDTQAQERRDKDNVS